MSGEETVIERERDVGRVLKEREGWEGERDREKFEREQRVRSKGRERRGIKNE